MSRQFERIKLPKNGGYRGTTPEEIYGAIELRSLIQEAFKTLRAREAKVLKMRFGLEDGKEHTLAEIGQQFGLTQERIRQIEAVALRKLKHPSRSRKLKEVVKPIQGVKEKEKKDLEKIIEFPANFNIEFITLRVDEKLKRYFSKHPEEMKTMERDIFEEMIAELFSGFGYEVELTKQTRDGGMDIIAIKDLEVAVKYIIEAKRPEPGKPVGVVPVRALYGVKCREKATEAILATTTYFTKDARLEFREHYWELELRDYKGIIRWINDYLRIREQ